MTQLISKLLTFASSKGGEGKTTLAIHVAISLARSGHKVLFVDADPQVSATKWQALRASNGRESLPLDWYQLKPEDTAADVANSAAFYDYVIADASGSLTTLTVELCGASSLVVIPVRPSPVSVSGMVDLLDALEVLEVIPNIIFTRSFFRPGTELGRDLLEALKGMGYPQTKTPMTLRETYPKSMKWGGSIYELKTKAARCAVGEIDNIARELAGAAR